MNVFFRFLVRILIVLMAFGGSSLAQNLHLGLRTGGVVSFPGVTALLLGAQLEVRALIGDEFGLRFDLGLNSGVGLLAVTRPLPDQFGPLYIGLGLGYAFDPNSRAMDTRVLIGYEWLILPEWRVLIEALTRFPFDGSGARLEISVGLNLQLTGAPPATPPTPATNPPSTPSPGPNPPNQPRPTPPQG